MERLCKAFLDETVAAVVPGAGVPITKLVAEEYVSASLIEASRGADMLVLGSRRGAAASPASSWARSARSASSTPRRRDHQTARRRLRCRCPPPAAPAPQPLDWGPTGTKRGPVAEVLHPYCPFRAEQPQEHLDHRLADASGFGQRLGETVGLRTFKTIQNFDDPRQEGRRLFAELLGTFFLVLVAAAGPPTIQHPDVP